MTSQSMRYRRYQHRIQNFRSAQSGVVLYFAIIMSIALLMIAVSISKNSIAAMNNANLIKLRTLADTAGAYGLNLVQNFLYADMKTSDRREINRIIYNPPGADGLYIWPDSGSGNAQAGIALTRGTVTIEGVPNIGLTTKTEFLECVKTSLNSTIANYYFKTTVSAQLMNQDVRQEQYWKMLGVTQYLCKT